MLDDLRAALRSLRSSPMFASVAFAVLALGIGAATAIFSVVDAVVLRGLPFHEHDRLAAVLEHDTRRPETFGGGTTTSQMFLDWRELQQPFASIAASAGMRFELRNDRGEPEDARGLRVTHEFFSTLRIQPAAGRLFTPEDEVEGAHRVVVLSHVFWQRWFSGSPDVVGMTMPVGTQTYEIVGVLPPGVEYPVASDRPTEMFVPAMFRNEDRRAALLIAVGLVIGSAAAWSLASTVEAFLFQIQPHDVRIFAAVLAVLGAAGLLASAIPARRASTVDPLVALRHE